MCKVSSNGGLVGQEISMFKVSSSDDYNVTIGPISVTILLQSGVTLKGFVAYKSTERFWLGMCFLEE